MAKLAYRVYNKPLQSGTFNSWLSLTAFVYFSQLPKSPWTGRYMPMNILHRCIALIILSIAFFQLYGIGERVSSALWMWYKFYGSNGNGITVGTTMTLITYIVSIALIAFTNFMHSRTNDKFSLTLFKFGGYSLFFGLLCLTILLVSPLAYLYSR